MADEVKQEEKQCESKKTFATIFKVILGLAFLALGAGSIIAWRQDLLVVFKGCIGLFLLLAGVITLAIARE